MAVPKHKTTDTLEIRPIGPVRRHIKSILSVLRCTISDAEQKLFTRAGLVSGTSALKNPPPILEADREPAAAKTLDRQHRRQGLRAGEQATYEAEKLPAIVQR